MQQSEYMDAANKALRGHIARTYPTMDEEQKEGYDRTTAAHYARWLGWNWEDPLTTRDSIYEGLQCAAAAHCSKTMDDEHANRCIELVVTEIEKGGASHAGPKELFKVARKFDPLFLDRPSGERARRNVLRTFRKYGLNRRLRPEEDDGSP